ncbi:C39 family peptidase [Vibrio ezurae]|nr:C39 family peptidase [Vibrio ezurae]
MKQCLVGLVLIYSASTLAIDFLPHRANYSVPVKSYKETLFGDVYLQQYDFSCGSAALASLLHFHYQRSVKEQQIFNVMYDKGNKEIINKRGFSLLDMKYYLQSIGLKSDGFKLGLEQLRKIGVPGITLVNFDGYMHFVVIKGMTQNKVILGDPSRGTLIMSISDFQSYYSGLVLLVRSEADIGRESFIQDENFSLYQSSPLDTGISRDSLGIFSITLPVSGDY